MAFYENIKDYNTVSLEAFEHEQDRLEREWWHSLQEKQDKTVDLAVKILRQDVDSYTFGITFDAEYLDVDDDKEEELYTALDFLVEGELPEDEEYHLAELALDGAAFCLYGLSKEELEINSKYFCDRVLDEVVQYSYNEDCEVIGQEIV